MGAGKLLCSVWEAYEGERVCLRVLGISGSSVFFVGEPIFKIGSLTLFSTESTFHYHEICNCETWVILLLFAYFVKKKWLKWFANMWKNWQKFTSKKIIIIIKHTPKIKVLVILQYKTKQRIVKIRCMFDDIISYFSTNF